MNNDDLNKKRKLLLWGIPLCIVMAFFQLMRGLDGNNRSWLYVFEWPFFAVFIYYMYWKMGQPIKKWDEKEEKKEK